MLQGGAGLAWTPQLPPPELHPEGSLLLFAAALRREKRGGRGAGPNGKQRTLPWAPHVAGREEGSLHG